jgi:hypothetical protein
VGRAVNSVTLRAPLLAKARRTSQGGVAHGCAVFGAKDGMACPFQEVQRRIGPVAGPPVGRTTSDIGGVMLAWISNG